MTSDDSKPIAELWLAKKVEDTGKEIMGANFGNIPSDYRGIKMGLTLIGKTEG